MPPELIAYPSPTTTDLDRTELHAESPTPPDWRRHITAPVQCSIITTPRRPSTRPRSGILIAGTSLEVAHIDTQYPERLAKGRAASRPKSSALQSQIDPHAALSEAAGFPAGHDIDLDDLEHSEGLEFVAFQASASEALLIDEDTRRRYVRLASSVRNAFKALLPDPEARTNTRRVAVIRSLAKKLQSANDPPDIADVMDSVSELLDRSVGAEEYIIRTGGDADPLFDLGKIDLEQLSLRFANNKRTAAQTIEQDLDARLQAAVRQNPTRLELAERFRRLIDEYNAGTHQHRGIS